MQSQFSKDNNRALQTLIQVEKVICQLIEWNQKIYSVDDYYKSESGMQLLAANCTLITAIGEGINRIERILPGFLYEKFPDTPWRAIIGMRNHIAHGYFDLDGDIVFEAVKKEIPELRQTILRVIKLLS